MISTGIVAEYNPFHNGHKYQIDQVRKQLQPDVIIAVMSGNFLQRGEPAIVDKWTRTKMALAGGVDLVVELPAVFAVQPADYFAKGALQVLSALDIDYLSFGVEAGTATDFLSGAEWMLEHEEQIAKGLLQSADAKVPYAKQMADLIETLAPNFPLRLNSPNNQLGFAYAKEMVRNGLTDSMTLFPVKRKDAGYDDRSLTTDSSIASATAIRLAMQKGTEIADYIPAASYVYLQEAKEQAVTWDHYFALLKYQLTVQSPEKLRGLYEMKEGLENRLKDQLNESRHFTEFLKNIKTKRYTRTRLQRLLTYVLLQWEREAVLKALDERPAIHVLGFSDQGRAYLSEVKHRLEVPLVANVNQGTKKHLPFDIAAGEIYRLGKPALISRQDFGQKPIKID